MVTINLISFPRPAGLTRPTQKGITASPAATIDTTRAVQGVREEDPSVRSLYRINDRNYASCSVLIDRYSAFKCGEASSISFFANQLSWKILSLYGPEILSCRASWAVVSAPRMSI